MTKIIQFKKPEPKKKKPRKHGPRGCIYLYRCALTKN